MEIREAESPWALNYKQCAKKTIHGVPEDKVKMMLDNYENYTSIEDIKNAK